MSQFCHNCGTKLPDDAVFCSGCGTRVKVAEQPAGVVSTNHIETVQPVVEPVQPEVGYASPIEPPKAEEKIDYASPVEPPRAEENVSFASPVEPPVAADQPIPGFGAPGGNPNKKNKPKKKKKGILVFFIIVLLLAAGAAVVWFLDYKGIIEIFQKEEESTYKEAIDLYVKGIEEQELDTFLDAYGSFLVDEFKNDVGEEFIINAYDEYESEAGSDLKIKYEVTKEKEYSESKLQKLQEELEEDYDFKGTIDKAYDITTEFTIEGDDGETDDRVKFLVVEIEGQWYLSEFDN